MSRKLRESVRVTALIAERDAAREALGHEKAMRASIKDEFHRFLMRHSRCDVATADRAQARAQYAALDAEIKATA